MHEYGLLGEEGGGRKEDDPEVVVGREGSSALVAFTVTPKEANVDALVRPAGGGGERSFEQQGSGARGARGLGHPE